jgi:hypothetical protein
LNPVSKHGWQTRQRFELNRYVSQQCIVSYPERLAGRSR